MTLHLLLDYDTLKLIWWALLGILLIGFAVMDGFDMGVGILLPFVARTDAQRRMLLQSVGSVWEGNQVWLILGAGASFAAWPLLYAVSFSGFYFAMLLVLAALILRPVGFDYRSKLPHAAWRSAWDGALFIGGLVPALVFGVAFGNLFTGVPFAFDDFMRITYKGTLLDLFTPLSLLTGLVSVAMLALHGATYLMIKTEGAVYARVRRVAIGMPLLLILLFLVAAWSGWHIDGYLYYHGAVYKGMGEWKGVYLHRPWGVAAFALALLAPLLAMLLAWRHRPGAAFIASGTAVAAIIANAGFALFPFLMPSSLDPKASLTVWNTSSSHLTLFIMLVATLIFLPLILIYTSWVYHVLRGKVREGEHDPHVSHY